MSTVLGVPDLYAMIAALLAHPTKFVEGNAWLDVMRLALVCRSAAASYRQFKTEIWLVNGARNVERALNARERQRKLCRARSMFGVCSMDLTTPESDAGVQRTMVDLTEDELVDLTEDDFVDLTGL